MKIPGLKKNAQEKVDAALKRARGAGAKFARGGMGTAYSAGTGAACFYVVEMAHEKDSTTGKPRFEFLEKQPYALPAILALAGHFVKRKQHDVGAAMVGVAGFTAAQAYKTAKQNEKNAAALGAAAAPGVSAGYGYGAGEVVMPAGEVVMPMLPAGMMHPSYGQSAYGTAGEAGAMVEPASARSFLALSDL